MYSELLLSAGGGINPISQLNERDISSAHIIIGLGGTGIECIRKIKTELFSTMMPDNPGESNPIYWNIRFMGVDSDLYSNRAGKYLPLNDNEFLTLSVNNIGALIGAALHRPEYSWLRHDLHAIHADCGAGATRQIGRFLFFNQVSSFIPRLEQMIRAVVQEVVYDRVNIIIVSGLCGGTGSGCFLDVCYLSQMVLEHTGLSGVIHGIFFMPEVDASRIPHDQGTLTNMFMANGYAALQELNYCMSLPKNGGSFRQSYGEGYVAEWNRPPVDLCYLIDSRDSHGHVVINPYNHAIDTASQYVMDTIIDGFSMGGLFAPAHKHHMAQQRVFNGCNPFYVSIGAASFKVPLKEIYTYLSSKVFERASEWRNRFPSKDQLDEFVAKNGLKYDAIFAQLTQECDMTFPHPDISWKDAKEKNDLTVAYFADHKAKVERTCETNYTALVRELEKNSSVIGNRFGFERSIISRIYTALVSAAVDPEKGPFYAAALLRNTFGADLISIINGYLAETRSEFRQEYIQEDFLRPAWEQAQRDFFENANRLNGHRRYDVYCDATRSLAIHNTRLVIFSKMEALLTTVRSQLIDLADNFMDVFGDTMKRLIDTFDENKRYLDTLADTPYPNELHLVQISELKSNLDLTVKEMDANAAVRDILVMMLSKDGIQAWINGNETEIFSVVNQYFSARFDEYSHKSITSYLEDKYHTPDRNQLVNCVSGDLMNLLYDCATPMFCASFAHNFGYISFPSASVEVSEAARQFSASHPGMLYTRGRGIQDRISIVRCLVGFPICSNWRMKYYEECSTQHMEPGLHIYEGNSDGRSFTDWRSLPSVFPYSLMEPGSIQYNGAKEKAELFKKALQYGVINLDSMPPRRCGDVCDVSNEATEIINKMMSGDGQIDVTVHKLLNEIKSSMRFPMQKTEHNLDFYGTAGSSWESGIAVQIIRDNFISSPVIAERVNQTLEKIEKYIDFFKSFDWSVLE